MSSSKKQPVTIRFRYNKESGEIEDLIIDDNTPNASEDFHDQVADLIARQLGANATIVDAGPIRFESRRASHTTGDTTKSKASEPGETIQE